MILAKKHLCQHRRWSETFLCLVHKIRAFFILKGQCWSAHLYKQPSHVVEDQICERNSNDGIVSLP